MNLQMCLVCLYGRLNVVKKAFENRGSAVVVADVIACSMGSRPPAPGDRGHPECTV